jgi:hypothetical protein
MLTVVERVVGASSLGAFSNSVLWTSPPGSTGVGARSLNRRGFSRLVATYKGGDHVAIHCTSRERPS